MRAAAKANIRMYASLGSNFSGNAKRLKSVRWLILPLKKTERAGGRFFRRRGGGDHRMSDKAN